MGKYFSTKELCASDTAKARKIDNTPTPDIECNLNTLIEVLDIIREAYGGPITISSGYRCKSLNDAVKGSTNSQHMKGEAADITCKDNKKLWNVINKLIADKKIQVDQLIDEKSVNGVPKWIHISYKRTGNRNMIFAIK